jgi:hypothetical protein
MSLDERLRQGLEGLDALEGSPPDMVVDAVLGRGRRSRWTRRLVAGAVALALATAWLVVAPKALDALGSADDQRPAMPKGDGGVITTVAGTGAHWSSGDGGLATEAEIDLPSVVGFDAAGNLYISDGDVRVRMIDPAGVITTVVGPPAVFGDVEPAGPAASLQGQGRAVDAAGNLYVATIDKLVKVTPASDVSVVAATGRAGCSGAGGPATEARLNLDYAGVAVDAEGNVYITQFHDNCVRKIATNGIITTIAGTGTAGFSGDGGPARRAQLNGPTTVALDAEGNIYISDLRNHRIRRIDSRGIITTVAGNGEKGFPVDGAVATQVPIGAADVSADGDGNIYISDEANPGVFKVDTDGILTIVAGTGVDGFSGDGGLATEAQLSEPTTVAVGPDGDLYIADWGNSLIRKVDL